MEALSYFWDIIPLLFRIDNFLWMLFGVTEGIIVGAIPGLASVSAIILVLPMSFALSPDSALLLLGSAYSGSLYGGSIPAILINTPGTPPAAATCIDGYPLAQKGKGAEALGMSVFASTCGGIFSVLCLMFIGPYIARFALKFGMAERFAIAVLGLTLIISLSTKDILKGLISGLTGLILGIVGMDPLTAYSRYTFGFQNLLTGIPLVPALIGLLALSQALILLEENMLFKVKGYNFRIKRWLPSFTIIVKYYKTLLRSSIIGTIVGAIPGAGGSIAAFIAYDDAKKNAIDANNFGKGALGGVAAPESANNAVTGGALATMLTLGIPGSNVTAILLGSLMIHGLRPGPQFFQATPNIAYVFIYGLIVANIMMLMIGFFFAPYFAYGAFIPNQILIPLIATFSIIGAYAVSNSVFDIRLAFIFGIVGYIMRKAKFSPIPMVLGIVLGPIAERGFRTALLMSGGNYLVFLTRPISGVLLILCIASIFLPIYKQRKCKK
ncbi:MAG: tripartite tricarboxylate transporter permease [Eubacteriales bacterium]